MIQRRSAPPVSLFAALALAAIGLACRNGGGPAPDAAGGSGGSGGRGGSGGSGGSADATGGSAGRDSAIARDGAGGRDTPPMVPDAAKPDLAADVTPADAGVNPAQLWFSGPDGDFHLLPQEPQDPF